MLIHKESQWKVRGTALGLSIAMLVLFVACTESDSPLSSADSFNSSALFGGDNGDDLFGDELDFNIDLDAASEPLMMRKGKSSKGSGRIPFICLNLSDEQKESVKVELGEFKEAASVAKEEFRQSVIELADIDDPEYQAQVEEIQSQMQALLEEIRAAQEAAKEAAAPYAEELKEIGQQAREAKAAIKAQLEAGEIDRETAKAMMQELHEETRSQSAEPKEQIAAIRAELRESQQENVQQVRELKAELKALREEFGVSIDRDSEEYQELKATLEAALEEAQNTLYSSIRELLDADQQAIWDDWLVNGTPCKIKRDHNKRQDRGDRRGD